MVALFIKAGGEQLHHWMRMPADSSSRTRVELPCQEFQLLRRTYTGYV